MPNKISQSLSKAKEGVVTAYRTDTNINTAKSWVGPISRRLPSATAEYLYDKFPIIQWLPRYDWRWIINDFIAGITIGVLFVPQGISYAKIATIPVEHGLYSSWLPSLLYFFLGTSKEVSTGPTSVLGLLTAEAISSTPSADPVDVATAVAFMVGVYALIVGALKLGFLLDFISGPILHGWISAVALVILLGQVGSLVGLTLGSTTTEIIGGVLEHLGSIQPWTLCIGFTGIAMLWIMEQIGKRYGKKNKVLKLVCTSRAAVVLIIYTIISYVVNRNRTVKNYKWAVTGVSTTGLPSPQSHDGSLLGQVAPRAVAPFAAMCVEHLGVGRRFGLLNGYSIDPSQEILYLGATNMVNSLFGAMPTGGAMSRTAVNNEAGARSPVNFLFTAAFVILTIYELSPALYWIPKATLAAIIIMAVARLISPPRLFYRYWRMSFIDFIGAMVGLWVTLFTTTEIGLAASVGFSVVYTLLRLAFPRYIGLSAAQTENVHYAMSKSRPKETEIDVPAEAYLVQFTNDILFPNAGRIKNKIVEDIKVRYESPAAQNEATSSSRSWNNASHRRAVRIRKRLNITPIQIDISPLRYIVLDFGMVSFIDITGLLQLIELKIELRKYLGTDIQFRFVNMVDGVQKRFVRSEWEFAREGEERTQNEDVLYSSLEVALLHRDGDDKYEIIEKKLEV